MDEKETLRLFLASGNYIDKLHNLSWKALNNLFVFFLNQVLGKGHIDNTDIENIMHCFGVVFVKKNVTTFKMFRQEALKVTKIYMLEKILKVANEKCASAETSTSQETSGKKRASAGDRLAKMNDAFIKNMNRGLESLKTVRSVPSSNRRTSTVTGLPGGIRRGSTVGSLCLILFYLIDFFFEKFFFNFSI